MQKMLKIPKIFKSNEIMCFVIILLDFILISVIQDISERVIPFPLLRLGLFLPIFAATTAVVVHYRTDVQMPIVHNIITMLSLPIMMWSAVSFNIDFSVFLYLLILATYCHIFYLNLILSHMNVKNKVYEVIISAISVVLSIILSNSISTDSLLIFSIPVLFLVVILDKEEVKTIPQLNLFYFAVLFILSFLYGVFSSSILSLVFAFAILMIVRMVRSYRYVSSISFVIIAAASYLGSNTLGGAFTWFATTLVSPFIWQYIIILMCLVSMARDFGIKTLYSESTKYGDIFVVSNPFTNSIEFVNNGIIHSVEQIIKADQANFIDYFNGIVQHFVRQSDKVGVIGLGGGSIVRFAKENSEFTFYEISEEVKHIAKTYFSFLRDMRGAYSVEIGDGRALCAMAEEKKYNLIIVDGFHGRDLQSHLVTYEACGMYDSKLKSGGVMLINVTGNSDAIVYSSCKCLQEVGFEYIRTARYSAPTKTDEEKDNQSQLFKILVSLGLRSCKKYKFSSNWIVAAHEDVFTNLPGGLQVDTVLIPEDVGLVRDVDVGFV